MAREVKVTNADRVLFPQDGITKGDLVEYYRQVAPVLIPHLKDRPFTMKRWREGIRGPSFFQKQIPKGAPDWIKTRRFRTWPRQGESRLVDFALVDDLPTLLWMVQMHCIDMNAWYSRVDKPDRPDFVVFDLDPPDDEAEGAARGAVSRTRGSSARPSETTGRHAGTSTETAWGRAVDVAHLLRERLVELELESYVKTSGSTGIHVLVPITRRSSYAETYEFAELVATALAEEQPELATTEWLKEKRGTTAVLVDHRQNGHGKTIATVYSVRPRDGAPVSTPLAWEELTPELDFRALGMRVALERVERAGDVFEPVLRATQALGPALRAVRGARQPRRPRGSRARRA